MYKFGSEMRGRGVLEIIGTGLFILRGYELREGIDHEKLLLLRGY